MKLIEIKSNFITEKAGNKFGISGIALPIATSLNGISYTESELRKAGNSWSDTPLLLDHKNEVKSIVGRVRKSWFDERTKSVLFNADIMDKSIQRMISDGRVKNVSIGARVEDMKENDEGAQVAIGIHGLEISLVSVPGIANANFVKSSEKLFNCKNIICENFTLAGEDIKKINELLPKSAFKVGESEKRISDFERLAMLDKAIKKRIKLINAIDAMNAGLHCERVGGRLTFYRTYEDNSNNKNLHRLVRS